MAISIDYNYHFRNSGEKPLWPVTGGDPESPGGDFQIGAHRRGSALSGNISRDAGQGGWESECPSIDGILTWIERHPAKASPIDDEDYHQRLEEKFA